MKRKIYLVIICLVSFQISAQDDTQIIRLAKLEIDSMQLYEYNTALKTEIEVSLLLEPGVLMLNAVAEKDNPTHITIMEIYANTEAYLSHLETAHFKEYKSTTKDMVQSLELIDATSIFIALKPD